MRSSLEIAQSASLRPIADIAEEMGLLPEEIELYGRYKAKVRLEALDRLAGRPDGKQIIVTAITPTPLGEGKTTTTIGLVQGLRRLGLRAAVAIRQPSLGPVFGIKGGGAGGGYSQVLPMEDINLHFTGDIHAISAAHDLAAAFLDNHLLRGNELGMEVSTIRWPRVLDVNDRALRRVTIGLGEGAGERVSEFHITAASEVMAVLALANDLKDLRRRLGRVIVAETGAGDAVTLEDLKVAGAMTVLLRDAIMPNLVQTIEGGPAFVHAGPFANIAHGNSSVVADRVALKLNDVVCTEGGFASDMGLQKFVDIKCRLSGLRPSAAVIVATIRALKMHGGVGTIVAGQPLDPRLLEEDPAAVRRGAENLRQHLAIVANYGIPAVVAINAFPTDHASESEALRDVALEAGAEDILMARHFAEGGAGAEDLARAVWTAAGKGAPDFRFLSRHGAPLREQISDIATRVYGADGVDISPQAEAALDGIERLGYRDVPVCMAKTQSSLSHDPALKGRPRGFRLPIRDARLFAGAGFVTAYCGNMLTMPGLPTRPAGEDMDIDSEGRIVGLF
ncbi:MAG TPA: formate--tetrahydrofolate ligase [Candidatus Limnocylindrales bacterium]|nr:formate--tetrahydrofolate ligase [Candidatus Limnocylindrales bacterium]